MPVPGGAASASYDDEIEITRQLISFAGDRLAPNLLPPISRNLSRPVALQLVTNPHPEPFFAASEVPPLLFCGDGFGQPKVEGAALSGLTVADYLLG